MSFWELAHQPESPAIHLESEKRTLTYGGLKVLVEDLAQRMPARAVFALECRNDLNSLVAYLAALRVGAIPLLTSAEADPFIAREICDRFEIRSIFHGPTLTWTARENSRPIQSELGLLLATSGSSGSPKLVRLSHKNLQANSRSISQYLSLDPTEVAITSLPLNYSYGLSIVNSHLLSGSSIVLTESPVTTAAFWDAFKHFGVTSLSGVPTTWRLLQRLRFEKMNLPRLRTLTQAGGRLDTEEIKSLARYCGATGRRLFVMYGQTEATARISYVPPEKALTKAGSIGIPIPDGELALVNHDGHHIEQSNI
jgi:long-chain acyl-CoA synthetase